MPKRKTKKQELPDKKQELEPTHLRNSNKELFRESPEDYRDFVLTLTRQREETQFMRWGQIFHQQLLEPEKKPDWIRVPPEALNSQGHRRGKPWAEFVLENEGMTLLKGDEDDQINATVEAVKRHPRAGAMLKIESGLREFQLEAKDDQGLIRTGKADLVIPEKAIVDFKLKTGGRVDIETFWKSIKSFGYHRQAAWYIDLRKQMTGEELPFVFVFCQLDKPHEVRCYELPQEAIDRGREQNNLIMRHFHQCRASGVWQSAFAEDIYKSVPPSYLLFPENWEISLDDYLTAN